MSGWNHPWAKRNTTNILDQEINPATEETLQSIAGMAIPQNDEIAVTYPTPETELYTYKLVTVTVATILVTYSDSTKAVLTNVKRTS